MNSLLIIGIPLLAGSLAACFFFAPGKAIERIRFEAMVLGAMFCGVGAIIMYSQASMVDSVDRAWWPVPAFVLILLFVPLGLSVAAIFRKKIYRKSGLENRVKWTG